MSDHSTPTLSTLRIEHDAGEPVARLLLDRPDRLNALSAVLLAELIEACAWVSSREEVKVLVVTGNGPNFSAGFDLDDFRGLDSSSTDRRATADLGRRAAEALTNVDALTIAAVRGHCVGGGLVLVAACDLRVAAAGTRFAIPEVDLGIPLAWGGIPRLVREIGPARTKELVLSCRPFGAEEAAAIGMVNRVIDDAAFDTEVATWAVELAAKPIFAIRATKSQVNAVMEEIAGTGRNANDADTLLAALTDPESRQASRDYLASRGRR